MKTIKNIKFFIPIACIIFALLFACENPWMTEVLQEKTITFESNGGTPVPSQRLLQSERVTRPNNPTKDGYNFDDWYEDNATFNFRYDFSRVPQNLNLTVPMEMAVVYIY